MEVLETIEKKQEELVTFTQSLIQVNSVHGNETEVCKVIKEKLDEYGITSEMFGADPKRKNILFRIGSGRTLLFNGHLDTVPAGDEKKWTFPPFEGRVADGKLYGRGASDMKGGLASLTFAAIALNEIKGMKGEALFVFNQNEEAGGFGGAGEALKHGIKADAGVLADSDSEKITIGCRGVSRFKITTVGRSAHTGVLSDEGKGINAVLKMASLLLELEKLKPRYTSHPKFPPPKISPGTVISGGVGVNVFPASCEAMVDCRLSLGQTKESILEDIQNQLTPLKEKDSDLTFTIEQTDHALPYLVDEKEEIVQVLKKNADTVLGRNLPLAVSGGGTDANIFVPAGIPCVVLGPQGGDLHAEDEWVSISSLVELAKIYTLTALDFLR